MPEKDFPKGRIHIGKRPWHPPIKGQPVGPTATTSEIDGDDAPTFENGRLSRPLEPDETLDGTKRWKSPNVVFASRELGTTIAEETDGSAHTSGFTKREVLVLQGLVDGIGKKQRARVLDISNDDIKSYERLIAEKVGSANRQNGLREALVKGVTLGFLDTSNLPDEPQEPLTVRERQVLFTMVRGLTTAETCLELGIASRTLSEYRSRAHDKLGLHTQYQVLAWAARDMMRRGQLHGHPVKNID